MKKYTIALLLSLQGIVALGQNPEIKTELPTVIPPSPTIAALMKFEEVPVSNLQSLSDTGTEANLLTALSNLRAALPAAMVTTYTYKPLIGISTMTDPKGFKTTYEYDAFNRLFQVKNHTGKVLSKNEYNYRPN